MSWSFAASTPVIVLGLAVWLAAAWLLVLHWRASGGRKAIMRLEGLRFLVITLLVFTLLRPEWVQHLQRTERPEIVVLWDDSASLNTRDVLVTNQIISRADWLSDRRAAEFWRPLEKSGKVIVEDFAAPPAATNAAPAASEGTDLNSALETVLRRGRNLKAVLLLTDGDWNIGQSPVAAATRYREREIPIFSVAVGRDKPLPDLALEDVSAPAYGLLGEQVIIPFRVRSHLPREVKTTVSLLDPNGEETKKQIIVPASAELQETMLWSPQAVGESTLTLQLPVEPDEALRDNNEQAIRVNVRIEKLKVLVADSFPRWEYRYLRNALERDPGVEMHCILFHPGMGLGGGRDYLDRFPGSKELISGYDVIFLGDIGIGENELSEKDAELVRGVVEQQASGLVLLPGSRGRQWTLLESPLRDLFPVVPDAGRPEGVGFQHPANLLLSTSGKRHWLTRFDSDADRNEDLWKMLPGFYWSAAVEKSRPGSEVLAVHSELRNQWGRMPLLVTRAAGSGKVLFMGTDSAWRWRRGVEDKYHYRFWSQVVRWMAHQRHLAGEEGIRLSYSPESPQPGDTVYLQATVLDAFGMPVEDGEVTARFTSPSKRSERLAFAPVEGGWGVYRASLTPEEGGKYEVELVSSREGRKLETEILVAQPLIEKQGQPINLEILREISGITRGAAASYEALDQVLNQISLLPEPKPIEKRMRLWSDPRWGGLILSLLVVYWIGRKLAGLI